LPWSQQATGFSHRLHRQMKQAHGNARGPHFFALHGLLDKCAE
jgi:DNA-binding ferritin-like protein